MNASPSKPIVLRRYPKPIGMMATTNAGMRTNFLGMPKHDTARKLYAKYATTKHAKLAETETKLSPEKAIRQKNSNVPAAAIGASD
jgi:hypothetical protein